MQDPMLDPMQDPELSTIVEVGLTGTIESDLREGRLEEALAPGNFPDKSSGMEEIGGYIDRLTASQRSLLRSALVHALGPGHRGQVSFQKRPTGYELHGIGLEVMDGSVTEEKSILPLVIVFVYQDRALSTPG